MKKETKTATKATKAATKVQTKAMVNKSKKDLKKEKADAIEKLFNEYATQAVDFSELEQNKNYVFIVGLKNGVLLNDSYSLRHSFTFGHYDYITYLGHGDLEKAHYFTVTDTTKNVIFDNFIRDAFIEKTADLDKGIITQLRADDHKQICNIHGFMEFDTWTNYAKAIETIKTKYAKTPSKRVLNRQKYNKKAVKKND